MSTEVSLLLNCRTTDMRHKEVINVKDGTRLGCVNDVEIDIKCARLVSIIIYGKPKLFGLFGRCEDIIIKWENVEIVGEDTILVDFCQPYRKKRRKFNFFNFFNNV